MEGVLETKRHNLPTKWDPLVWNPCLCSFSAVWNYMVPPLFFPLLTERSSLFFQRSDKGAVSRWLSNGSFITIHSLTVKIYGWILVSRWSLVPNLVPNVPTSFRLLHACWILCNQLFQKKRKKKKRLYKTLEKVKKGDNIFSLIIQDLWFRVLGKKGL